MCKEGVADRDIECVVHHQWRPPYGTGDGSGSDYEDIANAKPQAYYYEEQKEIHIYSYR